MAMVNVEFSDAAFLILQNLAAQQDISVSEFVRRALLEKMEDEEDAAAADEAYAEYLQNPVAYSWDEVKRSWHNTKS